MPMTAIQNYKMSSQGKKKSLNACWPSFGYVQGYGEKYHFFTWWRLLTHFPFGQFILPFPEFLPAWWLKVLCCWDSLVCTWIWSKAVKSCISLVTAQTLNNFFPMHERKNIKVGLLDQRPIMLVFFFNIFKNFMPFKIQVWSLMLQSRWWPWWNQSLPFLSSELMEEANKQAIITQCFRSWLWKGWCALCIEDRMWNSAWQVWGLIYPTFLCLDAH